MSNNQDEFGFEKMADDFNKAATAAYNPVFRWTIEDGAITPPSSEFLPDCVKERIRFVLPYMEEGMSLMLAMDIVFAYNEERVQKEFSEEWLGSWLPVSEDFKKWSKGVFFETRQDAVAVALIFGTVSEVEDDD